jgi:hypothetical protein
VACSWFLNLEKSGLFSLVYSSFVHRVPCSTMLKNLALGLLAAQSVAATRFAMYIDE